jgi:iron complex transport system substrate-binding protein
MLVTLLGPDSRVAWRGDFHALGIATDLSSCACAGTACDAHGSRDAPRDMDPLNPGRQDLARGFDAADRGEAPIADVRMRKAPPRARVE